MDFTGLTFQGHAFTGYDPYRNRHLDVWVDSGSPALYYTEGCSMSPARSTWKHRTALHQFGWDSAPFLYRTDASGAEKTYAFKSSVDNSARLSSTSTWDDTAALPPDARIGSVHSPLNPRSCVQVSRFACDDRHALKDSVDSSPPALGSDLAHLRARPAPAMSFWLLDFPQDVCYGRKTVRFSITISAKI